MSNSLGLIVKDTENKFLKMRSGERLEITRDESERLKRVLLEDSGSRFVEIKGRIINTADLTGIFDYEDLELMVLEKRGLRKCRDCGSILKGDQPCSKCLYPDARSLVGGN